MEKTGSLFDLNQSRRMRDSGIDRALAHADRTVVAWSERAYQFLLEYIADKDSFMAEDVRSASRYIVPEPPSARAWGGVIARAAKAGIIRRTGYRTVKNIKAHCTPAAVWEPHL